MRVRPLLPVIAFRLSSGLVVTVAAAGALALHRLVRRRTEVAGRRAEERVTEQVRLHAELVQRARSFRALFEDNPQPMFVWEAGTFRILAANQAAVVQYGYTQEELLVMAIPDLRWPDEHAQFTEIAAAIAVEGRREFQGIRHRTKSGRAFDVEIQVREVDFEGLRVWLTVIDDVTERIRLNRELEHQAFHDSLTGLPNRALFHDRVEHVHRRLLRSSRRYAVLMLDLDNFRTVNDGFGHSAGDELLLEVSSRLAAGVRPPDTAARLGGDLFGILLEDLVGEGEAVEVAGRMVLAMRRPFAVAGRSVTLGATIGIALSGDAAAAATDVVRNADVALFAGKAAGKDRHRLFSEEMHAAVLGRITLEQELREGISREEFVLRYQPKVDSRSGAVVGVEALVRWNHPRRGLLAPDAFLALAEESGLIVELDAWVLDTACRQASAWARSGAGPVSIAVNVSGRDLAGHALLEQVRRVLRETPLDPRLLQLELTESAAVQQEGEALSMLREIRALGVHIAIDDFGTGYSILSRLQDFPIDMLKIDRSFITRITSMDSECPIVSATVAMGLGLGLEVVAEGVETEQQRMYLVRQGCGQLQGYLISRAVEPDLIPPMLRVSPLPPIEDMRWAALESALHVTALEPPVDDLVRGLLVELQRLTGLDSVYLTRLHRERGDQETLFSRGSSPISASGCGTLAPPDDRRTSVGVPVILGDGSIFGTLGGDSERRVPLSDPGLEVMRIFASLIAAQIPIPAGADGAS
jgi:diguanylate cyclase (GGDEF)-like protein/PAS domain S-box-containing protein